MFEFIIAALLSAFVAVQLTKVVTNLLPSSLNTAGKTLVAVGIEIIVGLLVGLFSGFNVVRVIGIIVGTIVIAQFTYDNIFKPLSVLFDYLKEKCKIFISSNQIIKNRWYIGTQKEPLSFCYN